NPEASSRFRWRARCGRGFAHDELVSDEVIDRGARFAVAAPANVQDQQIERSLGHRGDRLTDGRQLGPYRGGYVTVVESNYGQNARHVQSPTVRHRDHRSGHVIVTGKDGGRARRGGDELLGRIESGAVAEESLLHDGRVRLAVRLAQRRLEPEPALAAGCLVRMSLDEADAAMAHGQQVASHLVRRLEIIDPYAGGVGAEAAGGDRDRGNLRFLQL